MSGFRENKEEEEKKSFFFFHASVAHSESAYANLAAFSPKARLGTNPPSEEE